MLKLFIAPLILLVSISMSAQDFPFGKFSMAELDMKEYKMDTSANAVVLNEYGIASINQEHELVVNYHIKIKILKPGGQFKGDFVVALYRDGQREDRQRLRNRNFYRSERQSVPHRAERNEEHRRSRRLVEVSTSREWFVSNHANGERQRNRYAVGSLNADGDTIRREPRFPKSGFCHFGMEL